LSRPARLAYRGSASRQIVEDRRNGRVRDPFIENPEFRKLLRGGEPVDLARVNLEIARDARADLDMAAYLARIDDLAARVRDRCPAESRARFVIGQINWVLFVEEEYRGNTDDYFDPRNSYLDEVIDRKLGIPITLSILYAAIAQRVGLAMGGVNLPMHYLLRATEEEPALFVDPFHEGAIQDRAGCELLLSRLSGRPVRLGFEHFTPCNVATTVARMLRNLKAIYLERDEYASALPVVRRLAALARNDLVEQRDWGMVSLRADRPGEATDPLRRYVEGVPDAEDVEEIRELLKAARREVAFRN